jgi:hypothetical protein
MVGEPEHHPCILVDGQFHGTAGVGDCFIHKNSLNPFLLQDLTFYSYDHRFNGDFP